MTDYRSMFDREFIGAWDLAGRDVIVEIDRVVAGVLVTQGSKKTKKPIVTFRGKDKGLPLNKTNARAIAAMYGKDVAKWVGKKITLYPTTTQFGNETHDTIRIRPQPPSGRVTEPQDEPREPGSDG